MLKKEKKDTLYFNHEKIFPYIFHKNEEMKQKAEKEVYEVKKDDSYVEYYNLFIDKNLCRLVDNTKDIIYEYKTYKKDLLFKIIDNKNRIITYFDEKERKTKEFFYTDDQKILYINEFDVETGFILKTFFYTKDGQISCIDEFRKNGNQNNLIKKTEYFSLEPSKYFVIEDNDNNNVITTTYFHNDNIDYVIEWNQDANNKKTKKTIQYLEDGQTKASIEESLWSDDGNLCSLIKKTTFQPDGETISSITEWNQDANNKKTKKTIQYLEDGQTKA
ncbi:DUF2963 domain-containing protein, partial ['Cynodon dactylon' phytoplasma]|uniref:DUF2963 domain-containing protein n=1 Tax='Cynodon dactylon' phytoplasma TaxID=295320 RepID=UPI001BA65AFE